MKLRLLSALFALACILVALAMRATAIVLVFRERVQKACTRENIRTLRKVRQLPPP